MGRARTPDHIDAPREHGDRDSHHRGKHHHSRRSRSPRREDDRHRHKRRRTRSRTRSPPAKPVVLPYSAKPLSKRHYTEYRPLFQSYLDIQKQIQLEDLDEREARGRWKSFVNRWNRGELARSWYDPSMLKTAQETVQSYRESSPRAHAPRASPVYEDTRSKDEDGSDDEFGPVPATHLARETGHGPTIPKLDDLTYRNEVRAEDQARDRSEYQDDLRWERKADRKMQKERLEELVPRTDPGSRERQLEKKRETTSTLHSFREAKEGGDVEIGESDLMGDDGIDQYKKQKRDQERQKNEREIRREEIMRAREAERDERLAVRREKESKTMEFLKQLAQERFG